MLLENYELIKTVYLLLDDGDQQFLSRHNLTQAQFYALLWLAESSKTMSELSQDMLCDPSNITRVAGILERKGLIARQRDETDRRVVRLQITAVGQSLITQLHQTHEAYTRERINTLSEQEQTDLFSLLDKLSDGLRQQLLQQPSLQPTPPTS
ncbi:MAG TPA: MarR family transcriptional regulator [Chloroflexota bacterium]|nr:MarR family transcriptional regulator [Chloroflexota bacterium]HUM72103.1 MarR family transcriptional regulator [Chloroflexota bacterium]